MYRCSCRLFVVPDILDNRSLEIHIVDDVQFCVVRYTRPHFQSQLFSSFRSSSGFFLCLAAGFKCFLRRKAMQNSPIWMLLESSNGGKVWFCKSRVPSLKCCLRKESSRLVSDPESSRCFFSFIRIECQHLFMFL